MDAADPKGVIQMFLDGGCTKDEAARIARLVRIYAENALDDNTLEKSIFTELRCYYIPSADGFGARAWMHQIAAYLEGHHGQLES